MDPRPRYVIPLAETNLSRESLVGAKSARLGALAATGYHVPPGFCVTVEAYRAFLAESRLEMLIGMELERKSFEDMRWEEIWDAALRIRSGFLAHCVPAAVVDAVGEALAAFPEDTAWAVRSSAPGEDSANRSFAGLHESYVGVVGQEAVIDAVRLVWASLWSDASMLYRQELALDPARSRMAVLVQTMREEEVSGVAFGRDPQQPARDVAVVEAVPGLCSGLVDGQVDPDRWELQRSNGEIVGRRGGARGEEGVPTPLLEDKDLGHLLEVLRGVESLFSWPPDIEWTGRRQGFTLLQARPITTVATDGDDKRAWYLSLRPGADRLRKLRTRVAEELIPALEAEGRRLAAEDLEVLSDEQLAEAVETRAASMQRWTKVYWDEFIPFAHGVRRLAVYYNDAVQPEDPYEFVGLLKGEDLLATRRNVILRGLADGLRQNASLLAALGEACRSAPAEGLNWKRDVLPVVESVALGPTFLTEFQQALESFLDVAYGDTRLADRPDLVLQTVVEMAESAGRKSPGTVEVGGASAETLKQRLLAAVAAERRQEALEALEIGKLSWRLRDNDNLLLARVESQLIRAVEVAAGRLKSAGRLAPQAVVSSKAAGQIAAALRDWSAGEVLLPEEPQAQPIAASAVSDATARQLIGQPAAPGLETGRARRIRSSNDLGRFQAGEVLVCDAIQPMMTHLVPLAAGVVERRGGMLIHGAIIARELGVPCVNGISGVVDAINDGDLVTVDGHLGIVTVGPPEFDLELAEEP